MTSPGPHTGADRDRERDDAQAIAERTSAEIQPPDPYTEPPNSTLQGEWLGQQVNADAEFLDQLEAEESRSIDDLLRGGDVAMLVTTDGHGTLSARPLTVADVDGGVALFLVDGSASWIDEVRAPGSEVLVAVDNRRNDWVSVRGRTALSTDRTTIDRLWSPPAGAFFDGPDDPRVTALQVSVIEGEYWSSPGSGAIGRLLAVVGAAIGQEHPGEHGAVRRN